MNPLFEASWSRAWPAVSGADADPGLREQLLARYAEPHRAYHTLQHLHECLELFDQARALAQRPEEVELALWFHDAIYDVRASDNEARSAAWAVSALASASTPNDAIMRVESLIMATRHTAAPSDGDETLLVDIDLSILGADAERFDEYDAQIRQEYRHVPGLIYRFKRRGILRSFLERPRIYGTDPLHERFERKARANLQRVTA
ncbi:N-methyl-D-aspartate receptor NMDAR2C subunit [Arenimonas sp.]|uniref:HD domain-containing protein n=1 Tax=Arenimonas sp. TaxID=1872635 RepID=UPI0039E2CFF5